MWKRPSLALLLALPACSGDAVTAEAEAKLTRFAAVSSWEDLDPAQPGRLRRDPRTGITFVRVPAGEFVMGSDTDGEKPKHRVRITRPFLLAETEVTIGQWRRSVAEFGGPRPVPVPARDDAMPMPCSWSDASEFCQRLHYRLPSEAEFELACLGGLPGDHASWKDAVALEQQAWHHTNAGKNSKPVRTRAANGYGLYDMLGNLFEWCADGFLADWSGRPDPAVDPLAPPVDDRRALRGGSWFTLLPRPQSRAHDALATRNDFYGFRPAVSLPD